MNVLLSLLNLIIGLLLLAQPAQAQYIGNASPVGVPRFHLRDGTTHCAGRAFAIQWFKGRKLLLAPLHLLGPGAGLPRYIEPQDVNREVTSIDVLDLTGTSVVTTASKALLKTGVPVEKARGDLGGDLMAFELPNNTNLPLLALSATLVPVGTRVWVLSKEMQARSREVDRYPGTVVRSFNSGVTIQMDGSLTALASSGAPVVNAKNEVVCMMVGKQDLTRTVVMGIPSTIIYARLYREIGP
ncbi:MAG: hypothetical protein JSS83_00465 [Cyanobacteria bacterium SZAS LIN-3]|nr:hypothetical protein [Cyanobacteria bacterium SZAS LIN-3]